MNSYYPINSPSWTICIFIPLSQNEPVKVQLFKLTQLILKKAA